MSEGTRKSATASGKSAKTAATSSASKPPRKKLPTEVQAPGTDFEPVARRKSPARKKTRTPGISSQERHRLIAEAAYFRAESRGFGGDRAQCVRDWLEAESEVDALLSNTHGNA